MPLVNNNPVIIDFDAKADAMIAESNKVIAQLDRVKQEVKHRGDLMDKQAKQEIAATKGVTSSWTEFRSAYSTILDAVKVGQAIWDETAGKYVDNAIEVGNLARQLGTTTEEASRLKEVSDDLGVGVDSLKTAFKAAQKDGISPTVDGLANLSDQYLKLQPGVERSQFLLDKFGKSGLDMAIIMEKGGESIRAMSDAVDENLIVTQQAYENARKFQVAQDTLNDSWDAFTYQVAPGVLDATTQVIDGFNVYFRAIKIAKEEGLHFSEATDKAGQQLWEEREATLAAAEAADGAGESFQSEAEMVKELADEAKATEKAIQDLTKANQRELDIIGNLTTENQKYADMVTDVNTKHADLLAEKQKLIDQGYSEESQAIQDVNAKIDENIQKGQEAAAEFELATNRRILSRAEELLSIDGLTTAEKDGLIERGIAMGIYTQEAAAKMREEEQAAYDLAAALTSIPANVVTTVQTNYVNTYQQATGTPGMYGWGNNRTHAAGGSFMLPPTVGNEAAMLGGGHTASGGERVTVTPQQEDLIDYKKMARAFVQALAQAG